MPSFTSRTSWNAESNQLSRMLKSLRDQHKTIWDLTISNPTQCEFHYLEQDLLTPFLDPRNLNYDPDPKGLLAARNSISLYYAQKGIGVDPEQIFITASTSEAYAFLFKLLFEPEETLLTPQPSYPLMAYLTALHDISMQPYELDASLHWRIRLPLTRLEGKPKAILVVNPNNPTGSYLHQDEQTELNDFCKKNDLAIISDEVFWDYALLPHSVNTPPPMSLAGNPDVLTLTLSGISKILGLPQMKLSWIILSGPEKIRKEAIARLEIISDTFLSASTPAQNALKTWLTHAPVIQKEIQSRITANNTIARKIFSDSHLTFFQTEGGWHLPIELPDLKSDEAWACHLLESAQVLTHPGYLFDFPKGSFLILSLLTPETVFREGLLKMREQISKVVETS